MHTHSAKPKDFSRKPKSNQPPKPITAADLLDTSNTQNEPKKTTPFPGWGVKVIPNSPNWREDRKPSADNSNQWRSEDNHEVVDADNTPTDANQGRTSSKHASIRGGRGGGRGGVNVSRGLNVNDRASKPLQQPHGYTNTHTQQPQAVAESTGGLDWHTYDDDDEDAPSTTTTTNTTTTTTTSHNNNDNFNSYYFQSPKSEDSRPPRRNNTGSNNNTNDKNDGASTPNNNNNHNNRRRHDGQASVHSLTAGLFSASINTQEHVFGTYTFKSSEQDETSTSNRGVAAADDNDRETLLMEQCHIAQFEDTVPIGMVESVHVHVQPAVSQTKAAVGHTPLIPASLLGPKRPIGKLTGKKGPSKINKVHVPKPINPLSYLDEGELTETNESASTQSNSGGSSSTPSSSSVSASSSSPNTHSSDSSVTAPAVNSVKNAWTTKPSVVKVDKDDGHRSPSPSRHSQYRHEGDYEDNHERYQHLQDRFRAESGLGSYKGHSQSTMSEKRRARYSEYQRDLVNNNNSGGGGGGGGRSAASQRQLSLMQAQSVPSSNTLSTSTSTTTAASSTSGNRVIAKVSGSSHTPATGTLGRKKVVDDWEEEADEMVSEPLTTFTTTTTTTTTATATANTASNRKLNDNSFRNPNVSKSDVPVELAIGEVRIIKPKPAAPIAKLAPKRKVGEVLESLETKETKREDNNVGSVISATVLSPPRAVTTSFMRGGKRANSERVINSTGSNTDNEPSVNNEETTPETTINPDADEGSEDSEEWPLKANSANTYTYPSLLPFDGVGVGVGASTGLPFADIGLYFNDQNQNQTQNQNQQHQSQSSPSSGTDMSLPDHKVHYGHGINPSLFTVPTHNPLSNQNLNQNLWGEYNFGTNFQQQPPPPTNQQLLNIQHQQQQHQHQQQQQQQKEQNSDREPKSDSPAIAVVSSTLSATSSEFVPASNYLMQPSLFAPMPHPHHPQHPQQQQQQGGNGSSTTPSTSNPNNPPSNNNNNNNAHPNTGVVWAGLDDNVPYYPPFPYQHMHRQPMHPQHQHQHQHQQHHPQHHPGFRPSPPMMGYGLGYPQYMNMYPAFAGNMFPQQPQHVPFNNNNNNNGGNDKSHPPPHMPHPSMGHVPMMPGHPGQGHQPYSKGYNKQHRAHMAHGHPGGNNSPFPMHPMSYQNRPYQPAQNQHDEQ